MTPWAQRHISSEDQVLYARIVRLVQNLPDLDLGRDEDERPIQLSCHILCRAFARAIPCLRYVDGYFRPLVSHTWLITRNGTLIDPYVPGALGVIMIPSVRGELSLWYSMYQPHGLLAEDRDQFLSRSFAEATDRVYKEVVPLYASYTLSQ